MELLQFELHLLIFIYVLGL